MRRYVVLSVLLLLVACGNAATRPPSPTAEAVQVLPTGDPPVRSDTLPVMYFVEAPH